MQTDFTAHTNKHQAFQYNGSVLVYRTLNSMCMSEVPVLSPPVPGLKPVVRVVSLTTATGGRYS
jgi:hypothetical protein